MLKVSTAPHIASSVTTPSIMRDVIIALIPSLIAGVLFFGINALLVSATAVAGAVLCEYLICRYMLKKQTTTGDLTAVITGLLLAFNLPSNIDLWMVLVGSAVAIGISKMAFGGLGKNPFNPALVGRVFLFISFPAQMSSWPVPNVFDFLNADVQTGATTLAIIKSKALENIPGYDSMFLGDVGGCIGEVSALALLLGLAYMLYRQIITWHIPVYYIGTVFVLTAAAWLIGGDVKYDPLLHVLSGGLMLGAIFMATDYVTSPMSIKGKVIFAIGCGILTVVIRLFGAYPEGVSFAILVMNAFVPIIDNYTKPRVFGTRKR